MNESGTSLEALVGCTVVIDVEALFVYIGRLEGLESQYLVLADADVHDLRDTSTTRELYILETRQHGIRANRSRVLIRRDQVLSLSDLDDVIE